MGGGTPLGKWTPWGCRDGVCDGGVLNRWELGNGRQRNASVASKMAWCWESDARGMLVWRPKSLGVGKWTPWGNGGGVQKGLVLGIGRH